MAACKISELVPLLVDQFLPPDDINLQANTSRKKIKDRLTKSVYKRLYTRFNSLLINADVVKENYSVEEAIKFIIREMELTGNYATAEALSNCIKQLSDDKRRIRENVQVCLRFLTALYNVNTSTANKPKNEYIDMKNENTWNFHYEAKWYNRSKVEPGVMHMYPGDIFEVDDPFYECARINPNMSGDDTGNGLELWTEGMQRDLQQMSHYSQFPSLNEFNLLRYNSIDESSQIASEYSSWNTPSDDDGDDEEEYSREGSSSAASIFQQSFDSEEISPFLLLKDEEIFTNEAKEETPQILTYEDSFYHCRSNHNLFLEQQFRNPPLLLRAKNVANLLIGLSSETFYILKSGKFVNVFMGGNTKDILFGHAMLNNFISSGLLFIRLSEFARGSHLNGAGSAVDSLKSGISKYLLFYEMTVSNTLFEELEHISVLNYQFEELCENLRYVAQICGYEDPNLEQNVMLKGIDFIDSLYEMALATDSGSTYPTLMFLIKHSFSPYLRFLQRWLFEGVCDDLLDEFRLQKNEFYERAKDESYWTSCYTISGENAKEFTPVFLHPLAEDILICGKSFNLLKKCYPSHRLFSMDLPTPNLELGFVENTTRNIQKRVFFTMLSRISCILKSLDKQDKTSYDENFNPIDLFHSSLDNKLHSCLSETKAQIENTMKSIFSENELTDMFSAEDVPPSKNHSNSELTFEEVHNQKRRNSWPQPLVLSTGLPCTSAGVLFTAAPFTDKSYVSINVASKQLLSSKSESCTSGQKVENNSRVDIMSSFSSFIYDEVNNPLNHDKEIVSVNENISEDKAIDRLIQQLMSDLMDDENSDVDGKQLFHRQHISSLIKLSLYPVIKAQIDLVNKCVLDYFFDVLEINNHFALLINFFGLRDGEFGDSLCWQLSNMVEVSRKSCEVFNSVKLSSVLTEALTNSINGEVANAGRLQLHITKDELNVSSMFDLLKFIKLEYEVPWPCNIIITQEQLTTYNKVFTFMLEIQHMLSISKQMWLYFRKLNAKNSDLGLSSQFRKLQLYRNEIQHFIKAFKCYIASEVYDLAFHEFQKTIKEQMLNLEDLRTAESAFISTMIDACLLDRSSQKLLNYLRESFKSILRFYRLLTHYTWYLNSKTCQWEHKAYSTLVKEYICYQKTTSNFYKAIVQLCHQKYQAHLEHLLLTVDFNYFYKRTYK